MKLNILILSFITFSTLFSFNSYAFKFSPMSASIGVEGKKNSTLFFLENDSDQPIAVTASLFKREMNQDGVEKNTKIGDELTLYPSQMIIPPNEKRSVKVTWMGKNKIVAEQAYRLIAEQLPIDMDSSQKKKASIKVLLRYVAALYVSEEGFEADVSLVKVEKNKKNIIFHFKNAGKKHQVLANLNLKAHGAKSLELSQDDLKGMSGENILAQSERFFKFPLEGKIKDLEPSDKVKINFEKD